MLIFQLNTDKQISLEEMERWRNYIEQSNKVVLLPPYIDFICDTYDVESEGIEIEES
jgi:hypothetical protein